MSSTAKRVACWNIAAINKNPFEYWVTNPDPSYDLLLSGVQGFIDDPVCDFPIRAIFTDKMFSELQTELIVLGFSGVDRLESQWKNDYSQRMAVGQFLKDKQIGLKRLVSMPDRITNTIQCDCYSSLKRPTAFNAYDGGTLNSIDAWWGKWKEFMFFTAVPASAACLPGNASSSDRILVCHLLEKIPRKKYPAITEEEQSISVVLQLLCLAILDAIYIFILNSIDPTWEHVRRQLCTALISNKAASVCAILARSHPDRDVIFIQEAANSFSEFVQQAPPLGETFAVLSPAAVETARDQNSMILVSRRSFRADTCVDVTSLVIAALGRADGGRDMVAPGDLLAVTIEDRDGGRWLLASFHGDSGGQTTLPVIAAIDSVARAAFPDLRLLIGLDANSYWPDPDGVDEAAGIGATAGRLFVGELCAFLEGRGLRSVWGAAPDPAMWTTVAARTCLQAQLNKATPLASRGSMAQRHLKDWLIGYGSQVHFKFALVR